MVITACIKDDRVIITFTVKHCIWQHYKGLDQLDY